MRECDCSRKRLPLRPPASHGGDADGMGSVRMNERLHARVRDVVHGATAALAAARRRIDALNVFPVPTATRERT